MSCLNVFTLVFIILVKLLNITLLIIKHNVSAGYHDYYFIIIFFLTGWAFKLLNKSYLNDLQWHLTVIFLENSRSKNHVILKPIPKAELYAVCRDKENYPIAVLRLMNTLFLLPVKNRDEILHLNWNNIHLYIYIYFFKGKT